jgi:ribosomal protein S18 acetylase RimI-like enzyme
MDNYVDKKHHEIIINNQIFILRLAEENDYEFILKLLIENMLESFIRNWGEWNNNSFKKTHRKEHIRIIEYNNQNAGYIDFKFKTDCGYLNSIQLSKKFQGRGFGTYLMKLIEEETINHGLKRICLKVFKDNPAVKLYTKLGYKPIVEDDTSLIMEKKLTN